MLEGRKAKLEAFQVYRKVQQAVVVIVVLVFSGVVG